MKPFSKKILTFTATAVFLGSLTSAAIFDDSHLDASQQKEARATMQIKYAQAEARDVDVADSFSNVIQSAIKRDWDTLANHVERSVDLFQKRDLIQDQVLERSPVTIKKRSILADFNDEHTVQLHRRAEDDKSEFGDSVKRMATLAVERDWDSMAHEFKQTVKRAQALRASRRAIQERQRTLENRDITEADDEENHALIKREIEVDSELKNLHTRFESDLADFGGSVSNLVQRGLALDYNAMPSHFKRTFKSAVTLYHSRSKMENRRDINKAIVKRALIANPDEDGSIHAREVHARSVNLGEHIDNMVDAATKRDWDSFVHHGKRGVEESNKLRISRRDWKSANPFMSAAAPMAKREAYMNIYTRDPNGKATFGSSMGGLVDSLMRRDIDSMAEHIDTAMDRAKRYVEVQRMIARQDQLKEKAMSWFSRKIDSSSLSKRELQNRSLTDAPIQLNDLKSQVKREFDLIKRAASDGSAPSLGVSLGQAITGGLKAVQAKDTTSAIQYFAAAIYNLAGKKMQSGSDTKSTSHKKSSSKGGDSPAPMNKKRSSFMMLKHRQARLN